MMQTPFPAFWIFRDGPDKWQWKFADADGVLMGCSMQPYPTKQACVEGIKLMRESRNMAVFATIDDLDPGEASHVEVAQAAPRSKARDEPYDLRLDQMLPMQGRKPVRDPIEHVSYLVTAAAAGASRKTSGKGS